METVKLTNGKFERITGNPLVQHITDDVHAPLHTILHPSWTSEDRAAFGVYLVDATPPDGQQWAGRADNISGLPVAVFEPVPLTEILNQKAREVDADFTAACNVIRAGYTPDEIQSWPQQQYQAEAYTADSNAAVPLLTAMAGARGVTVAELAARILANASAYSEAYGQALGARQRRQIELAAIDLEDPELTTEQIRAAIEAV